MIRDDPVSVAARRGIPPSLCSLLSCCLRFGLASLWLDPVPLMERELVARRMWVTEQTFRNLRAFSRVAPGLPAVTLAVMIGRRLGNWPGGLAAFVGMMGAPVAAAVLLGALFFLGYSFGGVGSAMGKAALSGVAAASAGIAFAGGAGGLFRLSKRPGVFLVTLFMVAALLLWHWPLALTILAALPLALLAGRRPRSGEGGHG
ncbi:chromate transporter [Azospirillum endophyticum]